ncbi:hypothetical protein N9934_05170, partial [Desulfosarcina sp.]|nr:hypothetical protein [Desulfosarcina sp.]
MEEYFLGDNLTYTLESELFNITQDGTIVTTTSNTNKIDYVRFIANNITSNYFALESITEKPSNLKINSKGKTNFEFEYTSTNNNGNIKAKVLDRSKKETKIKTNIVKINSNKYGIEIDKQRSFKPGKYTVQIELIENGETYLVEQDFLWGVLALNTDKSIYLENELSTIGIGVLDDEGRMVCDAEVTLKIKDPSGEITTLSTNDNTISVSPECEVYGVTNLPDYYTEYNVKDKGIYEMSLTAITQNGIRSIIDSFEVKQSVEFDVRREGPTRIFPLVPYSMNLEINANENYKGTIKEYIPSSFKITPQDNLIITTKGDTKTLSWDVDLKQGDIINLVYEFDAPDISPEFYLLGELEIGQWKEIRQWQIASDAVWNSNNLGEFDMNTAASDVTFEIVDGSGVPDFSGALTKVSVRVVVTTGKNLDGGDGMQCYHCETSGCTDTFDFGSLTETGTPLNTEATYYLNSTSSTMLSRIEHNGVDSEFVRCVFVGSDNGGDDLVADIYVDLEYNVAPTSPTVTISSIDGFDLTSSTLNCSATLSDPEADNMNVTVRWFENGTQKLETDYLNSWADATAFNATLANTYTNAGDNWSCKINITDGNTATGFTSSSNITISQYGDLYVSIDHPTDNLGVTQNNIFYINATVNCTGSYATCG